MKKAVTIFALLFSSAAWAQQPMLPPRPQTPADKISGRIGERYWALVIENENLRVQVEDLRSQLEAIQKREVSKLPVETPKSEEPKP